jgi:hypothetical protein
MSLIQPIPSSGKPNRKGFSCVDVQIPTSEKTASKAFSYVDIQALGLILLILMVISMPVYTSVLQATGKQPPRPTLAGRPMAIKTASASPVFADNTRPVISGLTGTSGASNRNMAR